MRKVCVIDGTPFEAKRPSAKYCSERCKKRAQRRPSGVVGLPAPKLDSSAPSLADATLRRLEVAGRVDSELGTAAMLAAARIDNSRTETSGGFAALMREYRATLAEAVKDAAHDDDALDEINRSAALKLVRRA